MHARNKTPQHANKQTAALCLTAAAAAAISTRMLVASLRHTLC
jgi:hypothetical protein